MNEKTKLNIGLLNVSLGKLIVGLFIADTLMLKSISFAIASICIGLIPSNKIWNYITISLLAIIILAFYITNNK